MGNRIKLSIILLVNLFFAVCNGQNSYLINSESDKVFSINDIKQKSIDFSLNFKALLLTNESFDTDQYTLVQIEKFGKSYDAAQPELPIYTQLLVVPNTVELEIGNIQFDEELQNLNAMGFPHKVKPALASVSKSDKNQNPLPQKSDFYLQDEYTTTPVVHLTEVGVMRNFRLYELVYSPIAYNPIQNSIKIRKNVKIELGWNNDSFIAANWNFEFNNGIHKLIDENTISPTYAIVSTLKYKSTLQRFIDWKKQMGFNVVEIYIGEQIASSNKNDIKAYLKNLYMSPEKETQPLSYLLIIGDVKEIPTYNGVTDAHVTDLNYAEYTNDFLPEVYYGRMSVSSIDQLEAIIDKTLFVEQGLGSDYSYQNRHLLISGVDSDFAPIYGNGTIRYLLDYYSNEQFGVSPSYYLYGSGSAIVSNHSAARASILNDFSKGAGIAYYTAHCDANGWTDPAFLIDDVDGTSNKDMYPLMIGNCCESLMFDKNSFGEKIVQAKNKGAVAYIGATNFSYWDEDYFWGVGFTSNIVKNPKYEETGLGAFDAWFHSHDEKESEKAYSIGQILTLGNVAVQSSSSSLKDYYWEVYHIMGDPSLVPSKFQNERITANYENILVGQDSYSIKTVAHATVSLWYNNAIIGLGKSGSTGECRFNIEPIKELGEKSVLLVVTENNYLPLIDSLNVKAPNGGYLAFSSVQIIDSVYGNNNEQVDFGETVALQLEARNYGNAIINKAHCTVSTSSPWVLNKAAISFDFGEAEVNEIVISDTSFLINISDSVPNNERIKFEGVIEFNDSLQSVFNFELIANAPEIVLKDWSIDRIGTGNKNGIVDPNETFSIELAFENEGAVSVNNVKFEFVTSKDTVLQVLSSAIISDSLKFKELNQEIIALHASPHLFPGEKVDLIYKVFAGNRHQYQFKGSISITLGDMPGYKMNNNEVEIVAGNFYDSGGRINDYFNNENKTMTFYPHYSNQGLIVDFSIFDVEPNGNDCFDQLSIYDGLNDTFPLIGAYCSSRPVKQILSQNEYGALTFKFISDNNTTNMGWESVISSSKQHIVTVKTTNGVEFMDDVLVTLENKQLITQNNGVAIFDYVLEDGLKTISLSKNGYLPLKLSLGKIYKDTSIVILMENLPDVCFSLFNKTTAIIGAHIKLENEILITDEKGFVNFVDVMPGTKAFNILAEGFADTTGILNVGRIDVCYEFKLTPSYKIEINIHNGEMPIADALVSINGVVQYSNALGITVFDKLVAKKYQIKVSKYGYTEYIDSIQIGPQKTKIEVNLISTGIQEALLNANDLILFPNPMHKTRALQIKSKVEVSEVLVFNYEGRLLVNKNNMPKEFTLDLSEFMSGIYILQFKLGEALRFEKVIIE